MKTAGNRFQMQDCLFKYLRNNNQKSQIKREPSFLSKLASMAHQHQNNCTFVKKKIYILLKKKTQL